MDSLLSLSPLHRYWEVRVRRRLAVLAYHGVDDVERFGQHIAYVCRTKHPVGVEEVIAAASGLKDLPDKAVLVTFDDGDRTVLERAGPILKAHGVPAVVYVIAGLLDTDQPFWWREVEYLLEHGGTARMLASDITTARAVSTLKKISDSERLGALNELRQSSRSEAPRAPQLRSHELHDLVAAGIEIGNHTLTHPCLHQCSEDKIRRELDGAQEILTGILGRKPTTLAYPNGDHDLRVRRAAEACGFEAAFLFDHRLSPARPPDPLRISRLRVNSDTPMDRFKIILSGLHPALHHARGRD
jgi:peptidoglycan/xylan/chitin deacetylase (PgdA/CDA1 family)